MAAPSSPASGPSTCAARWPAAPATPRARRPTAAAAAAAAAPAAHGRAAAEPARAANGARASRSQHARRQAAAQHRHRQQQQHRQRQQRAPQRRHAHLPVAGFRPPRLHSTRTQQRTQHAPPPPPRPAERPAHWRWRATRALLLYTRAPRALLLCTAAPIEAPRACGPARRRSQPRRPLLLRAVQVCGVTAGGHSTRRTRRIPQPRPRGQQCTRAGERRAVRARQGPPSCAQSTRRAAAADAARCPSPGVSAHKTRSQPRECSAAAAAALRSGRPSQGRRRRKTEHMRASGHNEERDWCVCK